MNAPVRIGTIVISPASGPSATWSAVICFAISATRVARRCSEIKMRSMSPCIANDKWRNSNDKSMTNDQGSNDETRRCDPCPSSFCHSSFVICHFMRFTA